MTTPQMLRLGQAVFGFLLVVGNIILLIGEMDVAGVGFLSGYAIRTYVLCGLGLWLLIGAARMPETPTEPEPEPDTSTRWFCGVVGTAVLGGCAWFAVVKFPTFGWNIYASTTVVLWLCAAGFGLYHLTWAINPEWWRDQPAPPPAEPEHEPELQQGPPAPKPWHRRPAEPAPPELDESP